MIHLRSCKLTPPVSDEYPFCVAALTSLGTRDFTAPVTLLVGENGSGKSTLLEALAIAAERTAVGWEEVGRDGTLDCVRPLADCIQLRWRQKTPKGFFMRAEDFINFANRNRTIIREMEQYAEESPRQAAFYRGEIDQILALYGGALEEMSHGEGFLRLFEKRIVPGGVYLIDEPEAALSPQRQLALLSLLKQAVADRCQFIIASHSPIVLSLPGAAIWEFAEGEVRDAVYQELEHVRFTRDFLNAPERYWRHL